jgi:hypothetical protein
MAGLGGLSIEEGAKEQRNYEIQAAATRREEEERERRFEELARRTLGRVNVKAGGSDQPRQRRYDLYGGWWHNGLAQRENRGWSRAREMA